MSSIQPAAGEVYSENLFTWLASVFCVHFILGDILNVPRNRHDRTTRAFAFNRWLKTYLPDLCELQALIANLFCIKTVLQVSINL